MTRMRKGSLASVKCPCGWHGTRCLSTTQPCPSCGAEIDTGPARAAQRAASRRHDQITKRQQQEDARIENAARRSSYEAEQAAENERISALLRHARTEAQR